MTEDDRKTTGRKPVTGKPATIDDVARIAGVSRSAVSRAYTPGASVSGVTRAKVAEAAAKLGYRPNLVARSLSTRRSNTIAIALTRLENGFHAEALQELSLRLAEIGFRVLLFITDHHSDDDPPVDTVLRHQVDAIILLSMRLSSHFALECAAAGVPVVLFNRTTDFAAVPAVTGDNAGGGAMVAEFLLEGGHQRIAIMTGFEDSSTSRDREMGFTERLLASGYGRPARGSKAPLRMKRSGYFFDIAELRSTVLKPLT
jgi:DNA-binding LacI/PurR family transcriptional regulator